MSTLVIDFSSRQLVCAVCNEENLLAGGVFHNISSCDQLPIQLHEVIQSCSVDRIVLGHGPGSYTGIRVSSVVAQTFGYCKQIPIFPVCSLKGLLTKNLSAQDYLLIAMTGRSRYHGIRFNADMLCWGEPSVYSWGQIETIISERQFEICASFPAPFSPSNWQQVELDPIALIREASPVGLHPSNLYEGLEMHYTIEAPTL
ncbi:hypothetical protein [Candidatus Similichlamydia epinepheli]|uniref:hypothetical protein n=1 Tax=Candidatus Similichlamydia epinepheli TaxID=1903953 RepID=UPI0013002440|nr:hypothetical protein [Candidatus Similichlamydia epinepheli]